MDRLLWAIVTLKGMEEMDLYGSISAVSFGLVIFPASCSAAYPEMPQNLQACNVNKQWVLYKQLIGKSLYFTSVFSLCPIIHS